MVRFRYIRKNFVFRRDGLRSQDGQLLTEILVAMAVGGALLIAATAGILSVIRHNYESRSSQTAATIAYDLINKTKSFANSDWHNIYNLAHGSDNKYYLVSSATSSLAVSGQESVLANDIQSGLIGYWKFDETAGTSTYDSSGSGYAGTFSGSPTREGGSDCKANRCLSFNGTTDYISIPMTVSGTDETVSFWVKDAAVGAGNYLFRSNANVRTYFNILAGNRVIFYKGNPATAIGSATTITASNWNMLTLTWRNDSGTEKASAYINGEAIATDVVFTDTTQGSYITIAAFAQNGTQNAAGIFDDVRIYNRALSANEISQLYNSSIYSRYFYIENVNRTVCSVGDITTGTSTGCISVAGAGPSDIADDPSTQEVNAVVTRSDGATSQYYEYLARSRNLVFSQTNWSGGSGQEGSYTVVGTGFSTSTNITAGATLTNTDKVTDGTLYSSTFDTQIAGGAAFNSIIWQGTLATSSAVKFQIASSNTVGGTGGGPTGAIDSVYRYAWNDKIGWIDFGYAPGSVTVSTTQLTGYAYNDDVGEISLDCATSPSSTPDICSQSNYKVSRATSTGDLSGWAWNDEIGWISFSSSSPAYKVNVNPSNGIFTGFAWNDIVGWISFNCDDIGVCGASDYKVSTENTGGWKYLGPDGTSLTYYLAAGLSPNISQPLTLRYHNNHRYVRYKVVITPSGGQSATVSNIILNWSP
jgi:hypothetical protein